MQKGNSKPAYKSRFQFPPSKAKRRGQGKEDENWRDKSQFHIITTEESDSDSEASMEQAKQQRS
jgi:hypothetical protein